MKLPRFRFTLRTLLALAALFAGLCWMYVRSCRFERRDICLTCGRVEVTTAYGNPIGSWIHPMKRLAPTELSIFLERLGVRECSQHDLAYYDQIKIGEEGGQAIFLPQSHPARGDLPLLEQFDARMLSHLSRKSRGREAEMLSMVQGVLGKFSEIGSCHLRLLDLDTCPDVIRWRQAYKISRTEDPADFSER